MAYWWHIKRYGDELIRVTEGVAQKIIAAKQAGQTDVVIPKFGLVATKAISAIEPSTERIEDDNIYRLGEGVTSPGIAPVLAPDYEHQGIKYKGGVVCNWYKKPIDAREWESYYAKSPGYLRFDDPDKSVWVAMLLPEVKGIIRASHLEPCDQEEVRYLDRKRNA